MFHARLTLAGFLFTSVAVATQNVHEALSGPYGTAEELNQECLNCHDGALVSVAHPRHWGWLQGAYGGGGRAATLGGRTLLNDRCVNPGGRDASCAECHVGWGWPGAEFDAEGLASMDCLACHDRSGKYAVQALVPGAAPADGAAAGLEPVRPTYAAEDLTAIAQSVGLPTSAHCGACHFQGADGHSLRHGDLTAGLADPSPALDVHMGHPDPAQRQTCVSCHGLAAPADDEAAASAAPPSCVTCHPGDVHTRTMRSMLNMHTRTVACEVCHVPAIARDVPTLTRRDWTVAGDVERAAGTDAHGLPQYAWRLGSLEWTKDVRPDYHWYDGTFQPRPVADAVPDPGAGTPLVLDPVGGAYTDPGSRIGAFKALRSRQYLDPETRRVLVPRLFGTGGYWDARDWDAAFRIGMEALGLPYSGRFEPVETVTYWPVHHMVAPVAEVVTCNECHTKGEGAVGRLDWVRLGYVGDPIKTGRSRVSDGVVAW